MMWEDEILEYYLNTSSFISTVNIPKNTVLLYEIKDRDQEKYTMMCQQKGWIITTDCGLHRLMHHWLNETLYQPKAFQYAFKMYTHRRYKHLPLIGQGDIWMPITGTVYKNDYCWVNLLSINQVRKDRFGTLCCLSSYKPLHIPLHPEAFHEKIRKALWMYREIVRLAERLSVIHKELIFYNFWHVNSYIDRQYQYVLTHDIKYPYLDLDLLYAYYLDYQQKKN